MKLRVRSKSSLPLLLCLALGACGGDDKKEQPEPGDETGGSGGSSSAGGSGGSRTGGSGGSRTGGSGGSSSTGGSGGSSSTGGSGGSSSTGGSGGSSSTGGSGGSGTGGAGGSGTGGADGGVRPDGGTRPDGGAGRPDGGGGGGDGGAAAMTFFVTSTGTGAMGGNMGGITGADAKCQALATAVGAGGRTWKAYLSASAADGQAAVNARERIGTGPWRNARGVVIAMDVPTLHGQNNLTAATALDEKGATVPNNEHDIMTGSTPNGMAFPASANVTCANWMSNGAGAKGQVGHVNRMGGGDMPTSWNSAHATPDCTPAAIQRVAGAARIYCFAID